jgi:hypothetical protein
MQILALTFPLDYLGTSESINIYGWSKNNENGKEKKELAL